MKQAAAKLRDVFANSRPLVLLDATVLEARWKGMADLESRLDEKAALWKRIAQDSDVILLHAKDRKVL